MSNIRQIGRHDLTQQIATMLRQERIRLKMNQSSIAKYMRISTSKVSKLENCNQNEIKLYDLFLYCEAVGLEPTGLLLRVQQNMIREHTQVSMCTGSCKGAGNDPSCPTCRGSGEVESCTQCAGSGEHFESGGDCPWCDGEGWWPHERS